METNFDHLKHLENIHARDRAELEKKEREYNCAWKRRGGTGAFHQALARKWDRLETQAARFGYDIFAACEDKTQSESLLDTIGDLRRYLALVEAEVLERRRHPSAFPFARHDPTGMERPFGFDPQLDVEPAKVQAAIRP